MPVKERSLNETGIGTSAGHAPGAAPGDAAAGLLQTAVDVYKRQLVQIIEGIGRIKALFLQVILTHDQAAVIEGLVEQLRHKIDVYKRQSMLRAEKAYQRIDLMKFHISGPEVQRHA